MKYPDEKTRKRETKRLSTLEFEGLRVRLQEAEETLRAIRRGEVDGLVVQSADGTHVYTLKGADQSYRILMEAMSEGALVFDASGTVVYANRRFAELVGRPLSDVIGARAGDFIPDEQSPAFRRLIESSRAGPSQQELVLRGARGPLPVALSASAVSFEDRAGFCVLVTDLSDQKLRESSRAAERKAADEQIRSQVAALESANRELESFVYSVSHDLRSPLRSIHRYGTLLEEEHAAALGAEGREYLQRMTSAARKMDELIQGLLVYTRISRSEITLHPVETSSVVAEVMLQMSDELRLSRADVDLRAPFPPVQGDALLLSQVLTNLLSNAIKFVTPGRAPQLAIWAESSGSRIRITVEDHGIGISPADQTRLFRVFERLGGSEYPGTGIGLAIVKRAAERMGGLVGVESSPGSGSRFWLELAGPAEARPA